jgi:hypothetical protein
MGIFGGKQLPVTSYGYQAPPGATVTGWRCPGDDCGRSEGIPPRRWPARCPDCGTALDPSFAEPWAHDARRMEIDAILRNPDDSPYLVDLMRIESEVWNYKDGIRRNDLAAARRAQQDLFAISAKFQSEDGHFVTGSSYLVVVLHGLQHGDVNGAAEELLGLYPTLITTKVDDNNAQRTTSRQFIACCVEFLEHPTGRRHPSADRIHRMMLDVADRARNVLTADNLSGLARLGSPRR